MHLRVDLGSRELYCSGCGKALDSTERRQREVSQLFAPLLATITPHAYVVRIWIPPRSLEAPRQRPTTAAVQQPAETKY